MFYNLCKVYNRWKLKVRDAQVKTGGVLGKVLKNPLAPLEFGSDDYIWVKLAYATCLMRMNQTEHAVSKFESTKRQIESELVYESPCIFVEACLSLGHCLLRQAGFEPGEQAPEPGSEQ